MKLDPRRQRAALARAEEEERVAAWYEREAKRMRASAASIRRSWDLPAAPRSPVPPTRPNNFDT